MAAEKRERAQRNTPNLLYFTPVSRQHFAKHQLHAEPVNARGVNIRFGREDVKVPDDYFDLL
jgi:hypothetical protein